MSVKKPLFTSRIRQAETAGEGLRSEAAPKTAKPPICQGDARGFSSQRPQQPCDEPNAAPANGENGLGRDHFPGGTRPSSLPQLIIQI